MIPLCVASSEPPQTVTPILEASVTATEADVAPLPTVILPESQAAPVTEQTQTASPSLPATQGQTAQSSGSEDAAAQFQISHRTSAFDLSALIPPSDPQILVLDAKGGEGASMLDLGGACEMVSISLFWSFVCDTSFIHVYFHALHYIHVMVRLM